MQTNTASSPKNHFTGSIPRHYDEYMGPMFFEPYAIEVSKRIDPSSIRIALELACGTGRVTRHLRQVIPSTAKLIASDISPDMLAIAEEKLEGLTINWQIIHLESLPFEEDSIDLVVCCFGYMFAADKVKAFAEAHRVLRPGGVLLFATWDKLENNAASSIYRMAAKNFLEEPLPETFKLPFSMNDPDIMRNDLKKAEFQNISIERVEKISFSPSAKEAAMGLSRGGTIYNEIMKRNPSWVDVIEKTVEAELSEKYGAAPIMAPMSAFIIEARK